jgi:hypothetical protein
VWREQFVQQIIYNNRLISNSRTKCFLTVEMLPLWQNDLQSYQALDTTLCDKVCQWLETSLEQNIPVILCEGTGRAADILVYGFNNPDRGLVYDWVFV